MQCFPASFFLTQNHQQNPCLCIGCVISHMKKGATALVLHVVKSSEVAQTLGMMHNKKEERKDGQCQQNIE
jgi:hypothetical protein